MEVTRDLIFEAINDKNIIKLSQLLENVDESFDIDQRNQEKSTALHVAIVKNTIDIVRLLLKKGADISLKTVFDDNCLHLATKANNMDMVNIFSIDTFINDMDTKGCTPLHVAVLENRYSIAEHLLKNNAKINCQNGYGETSLHYAVKKKYYDLVELLLKYGADPNIKDHSGDTSFHISFYSFEDYTVTDLFLKNGANIHIKDDMGRNAFHIAAKCRKYDTLLKLLEMNIEINEPSEKENMTALNFIICQNKNQEEELIEMIKLLVDHGADINIADNFSRTPLYSAILINHSKIINYLLKIHADPNGTLKYRPIFAAIQNGNIEVTEQLIIHGADTNSINRNAEGILKYVMNSICSKELRYKFIEMLLQHGVTVDKYNYNFVSQTFLQSVLQKDDLKLFNLLLEHGACINEVNAANETVLFTAVFRKLYDVVELLINKGANVNHKNYNSVSILSLAIATNNEKMVKFLLYKDAVVDFDSLKEAAKCKNINFIKMLLMANSTVIKFDSVSGRDIILEAIRSINPDMVLYLLYDENYVDCADLDLILLGSLIEGFFTCQIYSNQDCTRTVEILIKYLAFNATKSSLFVENCVDLIKSEGKYTYYTSCIEELNKMKEMVVYPGCNFTYYHLLTIRNSLVYYLRWENINVALKSGNYKAECEKYSDELEFHYVNGISRLKMLKEFSTILHAIFKNIFPYEVVFNICEFLSDRELAFGLKEIVE